MFVKKMFKDINMYQNQFINWGIIIHIFFEKKKYKNI